MRLVAHRRAKRQALLVGSSRASESERPGRAAATRSRQTVRPQPRFPEAAELATPEALAAAPAALLHVDPVVTELVPMPFVAHVRRKEHMHMRCRVGKFRQRA